MNSSILALRAITATTFQRILALGMAIVGGVLFLLLCLAIYLGVAVSHWWFLLFVVLIPLIMVATAFMTAFHFMARRLLPRKLNNAERKTIHEFTGTLLSLAEVRTTPWPVRVILIGKDVARGKRSRYIESIIQNAGGLKAGFDEIRGFVEKKSLE